MPDNRLMILVHPRQFKIEPSPQHLVVTTWDQEILVRVVWAGNQNEWSKVRVCNFRPSPVFSFTAGDATIVAGDHNIHQVPIVFTGGDPPEAGVLVKYDIEYYPMNGGAPYVVDPGVIFKPGMSAEFP